MNTFLKTFIFCIVICVVWLAVVNIQREGFEPELKIANNLFEQKQETNKSEEISQEKTKEPIKEEKAEKKQKSKEEIPSEKLIKLYFINEAGNVVSTNRQKQNPTLKDAVVMLLQGPNSDEKKKGIYSEIPSWVSLLSLKESKDKVVINLSSKFVEGGGTTTIMNRIKQLAKTVNAYSDKKPIYLYVEGKKVEYIGGDGVYLEQPLNEALLDSK